MALALAMAGADLLRRAVARFALETLGMLAAPCAVTGVVLCVSVATADLLARAVPRRAGQVFRLLAAVFSFIAGHLGIPLMSVPVPWVGSSRWSISARQAASVVSFKR